MNSFAAAQAMTADCLCFRSRRVARLITRTYDDALRPLGLEATQLTLLNAIAMGGREGSRMRKLADILAVDMSTLSRNLTPLEREEAIEISRLAEDRRVRVVTLTAKGMALVEAAWPLWSLASERIASALGKGEAQNLCRDLDLAATRVRDA